MDIRKPTNGKSEAPKPRPQELVKAEEKPVGRILGLEYGEEVEMFRRFFQLTGGSLLYCVSAVFVAYGIAKVMGPILSGEGALREALPAIFTLGAYELALLGALILIVSKRVVDDAISIVVLMALFLVGTSIALGSVADKNIGASFWLGLVGIGLGVWKFYFMRRFAGVPFRALSVVGLGGLIACSYLGPMLLARSISVEPSEELARRGLWLLIWVFMLIAGGFVLIEAVRGKQQQKTGENNRAPFLQRPIMVYVFALIIVAASGAHQYGMAFTFALERALGDFVPVTLVGSLLLLEILRHSGKRFGVSEILIACVPLGTMMLAIEEKSVLASGEIGLGLICYPPVILALSGVAIVALGLYRRWYGLLGVAAIYGLGVILTLGFSPERPHDLNVAVCGGILVAGLIFYGIIIRNQYLCVAGILILCIGLSLWEPFSKFVRSYDVTMVGGLAGVCGIGFMATYALFARRLHMAVRIIGAVFLAGFVFDYLPECIHWRYLIALIVTGFIMGGLWFRARELLVISILCAPFFIRLYMVARRIAHWRFVILGFLLLGAGTIVSLLKRPPRARMTDGKDEIMECDAGGS